MELSEKADPTHVHTLQLSAFKSARACLDPATQGLSFPFSAKGSAPAPARCTHSLVFLALCTELLLRGIVKPEQLPTTLTQAYAKVFERLEAGEKKEERGSVVQLLAVLVAAREPLSPIQLHALGLAQLRAELPLWGMMFYERDMRVCVLHRSLHDYILETSKCGTPHTSTRPHTSMTPLTSMTPHTSTTPHTSMTPYTSTRPHTSMTPHTSTTPHTSMTHP